MMASGLTRQVCHMRQHPCMFPRELRWEEVAPPQNWLDKADWPEPIANVLVGPA